VISLPAALMLTAGAALMAPDVAPSLVQLDRREVTRAIDAVRHALPDDWEMTEISWDVVPAGWTGAATGVLFKVEDTSLLFQHPTGDFKYHPFYRIWILPPLWEGRMEVADLDAGAPQPIQLGENDSWRLLYRTLGRNTWQDGELEIAKAMGVEPYPLTHRPEHTLDVSAMQKLFQRLHYAAGDQSARWARQIYGITELPDSIYLELLTWDERRGGEEDPTSLGRVAEIETTFLTREVLAAFPGKRSLYLRRVTNRSFSDVIVANPAKEIGGS